MGLVEEVDAGVAVRGADAGGDAVGDVDVGRVDGGLGGAVGVEGDRVRVGAQGGPEVRRAGLATEDEQPGRVRRVEDSRFDEEVELGGGAVDQADGAVGVLGQFHQVAGILALLGGEDDQGVAVEQGEQLGQEEVGDERRGAGGDSQRVAGTRFAKTRQDLGDGVVGEAVVVDHDALGASGGAGGVDQVGEVVRLHEGEVNGCRVARCGDVEVWLVGGVVGDEEGWLGVLDHGGEAGGGEVGVEGEEGGAGFPDGPDGGEGGGSGSEADADEVAGADAGVVEAVGELVAVGVELTEGQLGAVGIDGDGVRGAPGLCAQEFVDGEVGAFGAGVVPAVEQGQFTSAGTQQVRDGGGRVGGQRVEQLGEGFQVALHRLRVVQLGTEVQGEREAVRRLQGAEGEVEVTAHGGHFEQLDGQLGRVVGSGLLGQLVVAEHGVEERVAGGGALGCDGADDLFEGEFLVGEAVQHGGADALEVAGEVLVGVDAYPQGEGVDEEADQVGGVGVRAAGDRGAHRHVA